MTRPLSDFSARRIDGTETSLGAFAGSVLLVVNVASECGLTVQYAGLERLYETYRDRGFAVLGFPSNEFGGQEPGTNEEIQEFCRTAYGVTFPMFAKISVKGPDQHPLYAYLTKSFPTRLLSPAIVAAGKKLKPGVDIRWNFEKFLIGRDAAVIGRYDPDVTPEDEFVVGAIERALAG